LVSLFSDLRDNECRELINLILIQSIEYWPEQALYFKNKVVNLIYESEQAVGAISAFLVQAEKT
jgi:hypothetical protein